MAAFQRMIRFSKLSSPIKSHGFFSSISSRRMTRYVVPNAKGEFHVNEAGLVRRLGAEGIQREHAEVITSVLNGSLKPEKEADHSLGFMHEKIIGTGYGELGNYLMSKSREMRNLTAYPIGKLDVEMKKLPFKFEERVKLEEPNIVAYVVGLISLTAMGAFGFIGSLEYKKLANENV